MNKKLNDQKNQRKSDFPADSSYIHSDLLHLLLNITLSSYCYNRLFSSLPAPVPRYFERGTLKLYDKVMPTV